MARLVLAPWRSHPFCSGLTGTALTSLSRQNHGSRSFIVNTPVRP